MKASDIINNYSKVEYLATDGTWYKLSRHYAFCFPVANEPELFHLDMGGPGEDFFTGKLIGEELHRQCDDGVWRRVAPKVRIKEA